MDNLSRTINRVINSFFKGLVFLLPIFFLPWTTTLAGMDNFNKQNLLLFLVPLLCFLLFFGRFRQGQFSFKRTILDIPIFAFLGMTAAATIFSVDKFSSIFGGYSYISTSFVAIVCLILLYYFVINFFQQESEVDSFVRGFFKLYIITVLTALVLLVGYWSGFLKNGLVSNWFKLAVGNLDDFAMFIAVMNVFIFALLYRDGYLEKSFKNSRVRKLIKFAIVVSFIILLLINFSPAWACLLVGTLFITFVDYFYLSKAHLTKKRLLGFLRDKKLLWLNLAVLLSVVILLFNGITYSAAVAERHQGQKLQLGYQGTAEIVWQAMKKRPIFGYGPETYNYAFSWLRTQEFNESKYWYLRFSHGSSYFLDLIVAAGIFGFLALLSIWGGFFYVITKALQKIKTKKEELVPTLLIGISAVIISLVVGQIIAPINLVLFFLFWLFLGLFMVVVQKYFIPSKNKIVFKEFKIVEDPTGRVILIIALVVLFAWLGICGYNSKFWLADVSFKKALSIDDDKIKELYIEKAATYNPKRFNYKVALAKYYKNRALTSLEQKEKNLDAIQKDVYDSIDWARRAAETSPYSVVTYETLGSVYRDLAPYLQGEEMLTIETFQAARELEPSNPVLAAELGNAYLTNGLLNEALEAFKASLDLRADNQEAELGMAKTLVQLGQNKKALEILKNLEEIHPTVEAYYEQGRIYYNLGNYQHAIIKFQQVISLSPLHSNALYSLGLSLEATQEYEAALHYFKKVAQLNPNNQQVQEKVKQIEARINQ